MARRVKLSLPFFERCPGHWPASEREAEVANAPQRAQALEVAEEPGEDHLAQEERVGRQRCAARHARPRGCSTGGGLAFLNKIRMLVHKFRSRKVLT